MYFPYAKLGGVLMG